MSQFHHPLSHIHPRLFRDGFTLVELLVSIALFSILVSIAAGGFVNALRTQRQAAAMMAAQSNVSIALEQMVREIRTGYLFCHDIGGSGPNQACSSACVVSSSSPDQNNASLHPWQCTSFLEYYNSNYDKIDYALVNGVIERSVDGGVPQAVTGDNVAIQYLNFTLFGNQEGDHWNPRITVSVGVAPRDSTIKWVTTNLETSISARAIDCTQTASPVC